jgi:hypothetical protein
MSKPTGGPAFPALDARTMLSGMSLRDYFAAKAMQGELAAQGDRYQWQSVDKLALYAYEMADAMLEAREQ